MKHKLLISIINPYDQSLYKDRKGYISWHPGDKTICLDGYFSPEYLKQLANYMEENNEP